MGLRRRAVPEPTETSQNASPAKGDFDDIMPFINKGTVIPIISNSLRIEQIFRADPDPQTNEPSDSSSEQFTIDEQLTAEWAKKIQYPLADVHNIARVAQFYQIQQKDMSLAKTKYLKFLTSYLLDNELDERYQETVGELKRADAPFSKIVEELSYPRIPEEKDPLCMLAKLPLKIYVTTSYYNFIEKALRAVGKKPQTRVCFWSGGRFSEKIAVIPDQKDDNEDKLPKDFPNKDFPLVYHIFGLEDYPETLVLSEDDYMNFLTSVLKDTNTQNPVVPLRLREALAESRLLLLGYRVSDWDFRVLFRFILEYRNTESAPRGILLQFNPDSKQGKDKSYEYLSQYFDKKQFDIDWTNPEEFIEKLWTEWDKSRKGQS